MSLDVGTLVGYLKLDTSGVGKGIRQAQTDIRSGLAGMDRDAEQAGSRVSGAFTRTFGSGIRQLAAGVAGVFAVDKIVTWFRGTIDAASDANEIISKSSVIFGRNQDAMTAWARNAVRNLGMTSAAALDSAAGFGDMFQQLGFGADQAAAMSRNVVQMAADFGSFNNLGTEDVLERIAAGFRGEYDSLQKLIPNINAARVEQEALTMTGKASAAALTAQEKAAATLAIVTKDGSRAMGDFARTSDSTANVQKQAAAAAGELAVKVGNMLLPAYTALVRFGRDQVIPFLSGAADAAGTAGSAIFALAKGFGELPGLLQGAVVGLAALLLLGNRMAAFGTAVQQHVVGAARSARGEIDTLRLRLMLASDAAAAAGGGFRGAASAIGSTTAAGLRGAASGLLGVLGGPWGAAFMGATALVGVWAQKQAEAKTRVDQMSAALDQQTGALTDNARAIKVKNLEDRGAYEMARKMGISLTDVTDAALGNADAWRRVDAAMKAYQTSAAEAGAKQADIVEPVNSLRHSIGAEAEEMRAATEATIRKRDAMGQTKGPTDSLSASTQGLATTTNAATTATLELIKAQQRQRDLFVEGREAERNYEAALDNVDESLKAYHDELVKGQTEKGKSKKAAEAYADAQIAAGAAVDIGTAAGRRNQEALDALARSAIGAAKAQLEQGKSVDETAQIMQSRRDQFIDLATRLTGNRVAAEQLADKLGLSRQKVQELAVGVANLPATKTIRFDVDYIDALIAIGKLRTAAQIQGAVKISQVMEQRAAAEGLLTMSGVRRMAAGDVTRDAVIMAQQSPILWNEAPGGEAYIPLHPARRARSLEIWRRTGDLLGAGQGHAPPPPPVYVQNPFTGEYLLAQVDSRAVGVLTRAVAEYARG